MKTFEFWVNLAPGNRGYYGWRSEAFPNGQAELLARASCKDHGGVLFCVSIPSELLEPKDRPQLGIRQVEP